MKATERLFHVVLFIMQYRVILTDFLSQWVKPQFVAIKMRAIEQYVHVALFIRLYRAC